MNMKNILLVTVRSDIGGGPIHVNELIESIDNKSFNIFLACPFEGYMYEESWKNSSRIKSLVKIPYRTFSLRYFLSLKVFVKRHKIDIVHSHGKGAGVYSRLLRLTSKNFTVIHTFHGIGNIVEEGFFNRVKNVYTERLLKYFTQIFISVSQGERKLAIDVFGIRKERVRVIHNGVRDYSLINKVNAPKRVVMFTRYSYEKNMQLAYNILKKVNPKIAFCWVGDGDEFKKLKKLKKEENVKNLIMTGFDNNPQKYLTEGSIYLSTSRHEGLPLSLLEAESSGIPIVATNVVGNNEVVIEGYNGFLFDLSNFQKAVSKIEELYFDTNLYLKISQNGREDYLTRFTKEKMIKKTEKLYYEFL